MVNPFLKAERRVGVAEGVDGPALSASVRRDAGVLNQGVEGLFERPDWFPIDSAEDITIQGNLFVPMDGRDAEPFEAWLEPNAASWRCQSVHDTRDDEILALHADGLSGRKIARELGMSVPTVARRIVRLKDGGVRQ